MFTHRNTAIPALASWHLQGSNTTHCTPTCLLDVSTSNSSCRSCPKPFIAGRVKLTLLPGSSTTSLHSALPAAFSSHLPLLLMSRGFAAAELAVLLLRGLLLGVLVMGGPLLPCNVTKRAALLVPDPGWLQVTTVTCTA